MRWRMPSANFSASWWDKASCIVLLIKAIQSVLSNRSLDFPGGVHFGNWLLLWFQHVCEHWALFMLSIATLHTFNRFSAFMRLAAALGVRRKHFQAASRLLVFVNRGAPLEDGVGLKWKKQSPWQPQIVLCNYNRYKWLAIVHTFK